jgi:hypothetical protein
MDGSSEMTFRDQLVTVIGAVLLAGGLLALSVPVSLGDYDSRGIQVGCGNGYYSQLLQATVDDEESGRQAAPGTNYVEQCESAIAHRRAWAVPIAGLGVVILVAEVVQWARSRATEPGSAAAPHAWSADHPDQNMHEAAVLDRRERPHPPRPSDTTL